MPKKQTIKKAQADKRAGKAASTQAGEFVKEEIETIRQGKHGARNAKQAIAIGLAKARAAGVDLPAKGSKKTTKKVHHIHQHKVDPKRSNAAEKRLQKEPRRAASHRALSRQAKKVSRTKKAA